MADNDKPKDCIFVGDDVAEHGSRTFSACRFGEVSFLQALLSEAFSVREYSGGGR